MPATTGSEAGVLRMQDLVKGRGDQLEAHEDDQQGNEQAGEIFDPAVSEGMPGIRLLARHFEADQRDQGGARIGKVVEGVRCDGDGVAEKPREEFPQEKHRVQADPNGSAEHAVGLPDLRTLRFPVIFDKKPCQK